MIEDPLSQIRVDVDNKNHRYLLNYLPKFSCTWYWDAKLGVFNDLILPTHSLAPSVIDLSQLVRGLLMCLLVFEGVVDHGFDPSDLECGLRTGVKPFVCGRTRTLGGLERT